ncbi:ABC transporter substrate-binding protein [Alkalibacter mobilis]|uniref:ABC transporter substrate-binding protein n=1 Tax=Alkalibacter mobilis TaxID=2787712 RepID=UPI00189E1082|nr:ABC transporter substrate-binding protein [Alkalibacter mobilis]MBF7097155.1 ABC transporter substrate-binding protein [Alkalibacter mobilis]
MKNFKITFTLLLLVLGLIAFAGCDGTKNEKTTVILDWTPNTNHTGLYVALEKGYFEEEGLDVEIVQPMEGSSTTLVAAGQGDFAVSYQEDVTFALTGKEPLPVKAIATIIQENTSGFASRKSENITTVKDFEGKVYGGWGSPSEEAILKAVMESAGADHEALKNVNIGTDDFFAATEKEIDIVWIFEGWTGIEAELRGVDLDYMPLKDLDERLNYYTPILITNNTLIDEDPEKIEAFLRAAEKGYMYAIDNPEDAAEILLKKAPELDRTLVIESQKFLAGQYMKGVEKWGDMKGSIWKDYSDFLMENGLLERELEVDNAYTNEFLHK